VDQPVTTAAGEEDFVTAVFAGLDPGGWLELVSCGHPPPLLLAADGGLRALTGPAATSGPGTAWTRCVTRTFRRPRTGCCAG
jgi:serine phosphatase RsbU (regulator of sigma subunit)